MSARESHGLSGRLTLIAYDAGRVVDRRDVKNLITSAGRNLVARYFTGGLQAAPELYIAVGGGTVPASLDDTALGLPLARARADVPVIHGSTATVVATLPATGSGDVQPLTEAGIVIELGAGRTPVLYNRVTFPVVSRSPTLDITLSWEVVF